MRILAVTNMYPTRNAPHLGIFVKQQIDSLVEIGLEVECIVVERLEKGMGCYLGLCRRVQARIDDWNPDIVHIMYGGVMADMITRTVADRPTIVTFHGSDILGEHLSGRLRELIAEYGVWASRRAARRASGIVAVSTQLRDALPNDVHRTRIRILPCGIDLQRFKPLDQDICRRRLGWHKDRFNILFPTNGGDPRKRLDLAQAAVEVVKQYGIGVELHQLRGVAHDEVALWLNASDVLLLTSLHEGSPTAVKEALACNRPVVSVDVGDVREWIEGIEGCYVGLPVASDLAAKLRLVHARQSRVAGRIKMQKLSLEHIAYCLMEFYEEVLARYECRRNQLRKHHGTTGRPYLPDQTENNTVGFIALH
jgi:teichuronic acid biosynthesis glycosyltransferase TuaC